MKTIQLTHLFDGESTQYTPLDTLECLARDASNRGKLHVEKVHGGVFLRTPRRTPRYRASGRDGESEKSLRQPSQNTVHLLAGEGS
jgi:hypothetical protein